MTVIQVTVHIFCVFFKYLSLSFNHSHLVTADLTPVNPCIISVPVVVVVYLVINIYNSKLRVSSITWDDADRMPPSDVIDLLNRQLLL